MASENSFDARAELEVGGRTYEIYRLEALQSPYDVARLPFSLKVLLENLLRNEDGVGIRREDIEALATWDAKAEPSKEIAFTPARVILQDFTGVPCVVDLAAMRDAMADMGGDPAAINPLVPVELVIDHSVQVDAFGSAQAFQINAEKEYERNGERYAFLRWGQTAFEGFKAVPPDTGIVHQVNLEYLARVVFENDGTLYPDTLVGTDSHTTMINGLGVLGWGVGGIEAEAAMLGQPMSMLIPRVIGFKLGGELREGATATDLVLTVTQRLREHGVVGQFVEFYGPGIANLPLADRATIGNMSPEFGSTCAIFPIDAETLRYLEFSGRTRRARRAGGDLRQGAGPVARRGRRGADVLRDARARPRRGRPVARRPEAPAGPRLADRGQGVVPDGARGHGRGRAHGRRRARRTARSPRPIRPPAWATPTQDREAEDAGAETGGDAGRRPHLRSRPAHARRRHGDRARPRPRRDRRDHVVHEHVEPVGDDRRRAARPQRRRARPQVEAVGQDVARAGLQGRDGVLRSRRGWSSRWRRSASTSSATAARPASATPARCPTRSPSVVNAEDLAVVSVLSGNRNFEGRINPDVKMNYLASPPLVVAYALAGTMDIDLLDEPLGQDADGDDVFLHDIWPSSEEVGRVVEEAVRSEMFQKSYGEVFDGGGVERARGARRATASPGTTTRRTSAAPRSSRTCRASPSRAATSRARACSRCSATR